MKKLEIGQKGSFAKTISEHDVYSFAGITGDFNTAHINAEVMKDSMFGQRIAHGMLVGSLISTVLGTYMPGPGTIYMEQDLKFLKPVFYNDTVTATAEVTECLKPEKGIYKLKTTITNQKGEVVTDGYAVVMYR